MADVGSDESLDKGINGCLWRTLSSSIIVDVSLRVMPIRFLGVTYAKTKTPHDLRGAGLDRRNFLFWMFHLPVFTVPVIVVSLNWMVGSGRRRALVYVGR